MRVLLVYDVNDWAWHHKARALQKHLKSHFEKIDIKSLKELQKSDLNKYHSVHLFGWADRPGWTPHSTCGVSSHNFEHKIAKAKKLLPKYRAITAVSMMIYSKLKKKKLNKNIYLCENGVDTEMFYPKQNDGQFTVGWVGQPTELPHDQHGYTTLWKPIRQKLDRVGIKYKEIKNTWKTAIPHKEMVKFYHSIDVLVHTGRMTGTPNPAFEAAACGKAVVSTKIGAISELCCAEIVENDPIDEIRHMIGEYNNDRTMCVFDGMELHREICEEWTWKKKALEWLPVLKNHARKL